MPEECRLFAAFVAATRLLHVSVEVESAKNVSALLLKALLPLLSLLQDLLSHYGEEVEALFNGQALHLLPDILLFIGRELFLLSIVSRFNH